MSVSRPLVLITEKTVFRFLNGAEIQIEKINCSKNKWVRYFAFFSYGPNVVNEYDLVELGIENKLYYKTLAEAKKESFKIMEEIINKKEGA
jgi:hypothetical protein